MWTKTEKSGRAVINGLLTKGWSKIPSKTLPSVPSLKHSANIYATDVVSRPRNTSVGR